MARSQTHPAAGRQRIAVVVLKVNGATFIPFASKSADRKWTNEAYGMNINSFESVLRS